MRTLEGKRLVLRSVKEGDVPRLVEIMREPEVAKWAFLLEEYDLLGTSPDGADAISTFVVTLDGVTIGWICGYEKSEPDYRHAGIDLFLTTAAHGKGYGPEAIRLVCRFLFDDRGHHRVVIDPAVDNTRAIRAYEKVGFRKVGVMREYERRLDGKFHDGILMDLLKSDLPIEH